MKVAFIHPFLFRLARGIERSTQDMANSFVTKGIDVTLITWKTNNITKIVTLDPRVKIHAWPTFRYYEAKTIIPFYVYDLFKNDYDIINIHFSCYGENEAIYFASLIKKIRFNIIFRYPYALAPHRYHEFNKNSLWEKASKIISVSKYVADGVRQVFNKQSEVILNGVDVNFFKPDAESANHLRKKINILPETKILLTAAALEERKGIQYIIKAIPRILKTETNIKLIVLGEGNYADTLKRLVKYLRLDNIVLFSGISNQINHFYNLADIFLILSKGEASPRVPIESLSSGTPVITAKNRPFDEIIHPDCGIMVNEKDPEEIANAVIELLKNEDKRVEMGKNAREYIVKNFNWDIVAKKYINIFHEEIKT